VKEWFSLAEIVEARSPELPGTVRNLNALAVASNWRADPARARRAGGKGGGWEYHLSALPPGAQARLALLSRAGNAPDLAPTVDDTSAGVWARFEAISDKQKAECRRRLACLHAVEQLAATGVGATNAVLQAAAMNGTSPASIYNWQKLVKGVARADWLAVLAPSYQATASFSDCREEVWEALTSDWLRAEKPTFSSCYRRVRKAASKQGWLPIPSERALRRRVEAEIPAGVIALAREGKDKAKTLYPAQTRIRTHFHAMQAVNMDGHKLDVFVRLHDGRITRVQLLGLQDLYSGTILAWRISETENKETVRLVIGDMVERHGIPEKIWLDNGRAFASKWISGRIPNRYRFTIRDEDPQGILVSLGIQPMWTKPYSGQSKPIERAWRDLADNIAKHPFCAGAYTGNSPEAKPENYGNAAIPIDEFRGHVAREIEEHNTRSGRQSAACSGRSFLETFKASLAEPASIVRWPTEAQRYLWLLAAEKVTAQRGSGEIHFYENRYWSVELNAHAGQKVIVRFDPDRLQDNIKVYTLDDRLICTAACIAATGFDDVDAARTHARDRGAYQRTLREQARLHQKMTAAELARLYGSEQPASKPEPTKPAIKRLAIANGGAAPAPIPADDFEESFAAGLALLRNQRQGDAEIIPFTPRSAEDG
jgi:putative transposase